MEKRTILAMILSLVVVIGFQAYQAKMAPRKPPSPPTPTPAAGNGQPGGTTAAPPTPTARIDDGRPAPVTAVATAPPVDAPLREDLTLETAEFIARLSNDGAKVLSFILKNPIYNDPDTRQPLDLLKPSRSQYPALILESPMFGADRGEWTRWRVEAEEPDRIVFSHPLPGGGTITKTIAESDKPYGLDVTLASSEADALGDYALVGTTAMTPEDEGRNYVPRDQGVEGTIFGVAGIVKETDVVLKSELAKDLPPPGSKEPREFAGNTTFGGAASKYFAVVLIPGKDVPSPTLFLEHTKVEIGYGRPVQESVRSGYRVAAGRRGGVTEHRYTFFAGPKVQDDLGKYPEAKLTRLLDFSSAIPFAEALSTLFLWILKKLHGVVASYGVAIILLTVIVRIMLHPLSRASIKNMMKMQKLAPKIREIQEKYKGKKSKEAAQKMNLEVIELYRSHGTSPLLGCLPTLLQFPVFIGLYNALAYSIELRGTQFLYIRDLSRPDHLFTFGGANIPYIGGYFNLLPILMVITMVLQQRMQPTPPDPQQQQQAKMMQYMMIFFGVLFYHVPSGLVLYFLTSSLLGMVEQKWVKHQLQGDEPQKPV